ncbi:MAG: hypothetical protein AAFY38_00155 [Pseudomonadota bacterium]
MIERLKTLMTKVAAAIWCHRVSYASLAAIYGAGCFGLVDKETVAQVATALYVAISAQRH